MPSEDYIRRVSVLEVKTADDLFSSKLGVTSYEMSCGTCDNFTDDCPGHWGHLNLGVPVYRVWFVPRLLQILNSICFFCQELRIRPEDASYRKVQRLPLNERLSAIAHLSAQVKNCPHCAKPTIFFDKEDRLCTFIKAVVDLTSEDFAQYRDNPHWKPSVRISPTDLYCVLKLLSAQTIDMLGCSQDNLPESHMYMLFPVPPLNTRPSLSFDGIGGSHRKRSMNDWSKFLRNILNARDELAQVMSMSDDGINICTYTLNGVESRDFHECFQYGFMNKKKDRLERSKNIKTQETKKNDASRGKRKRTAGEAAPGAVEDAWRTLMYEIAAFQSKKHHKKWLAKGASTYGKPLENVEDRFSKQKRGRFRKNIIAFRVDNAGRGVLEGDIYLRVDQVGIPKQEAMKLSVKTYVFGRNVTQVQKWILNGPYTYPGANYVTLKNGTEINLAIYENRRNIQMDQVLFVRRHLLDDDIVMVNRQPTLHRPSMMAFDVKIIEGYAIRLHYAVFTPLGADCDGDEINFHVPQTMDAMIELKEIASVRHQVMKDGKVWVKFIQNPVVAAYLLSGNIWLTESQMHNVLDWLPDFWEMPAPEKTDPEPLWTGRQLFSALLPKDFYLNSKKPELFIENGQWIRGEINAQVLNGQNGILHHLYLDYQDREVFMSFVYRACIVLQNFLDLYGLSVGYFDTAFEHHKAPPEIQARWEKLKRHVQQLEEYSASLEHYSPGHEDVEVENNLRTHIDWVTNESTQLVMDYHTQRNPANAVLAMIQSGAKGNKTALNQMCGIVGQVYVMRKRYDHKTSHVPRGKHSMRAHGFITDSYSTGVSLMAAVSEAHATCESIIEKCRGTGQSGYSVRKMITVMMGVIIDQLGRVVDTSGRVLWSRYGNDGYDPQLLVNEKIRLASYCVMEVLQHYGVWVSVRDVVAMWTEPEQTKWPLEAETLDYSSLVQDYLTEDAWTEWTACRAEPTLCQPLQDEIVQLTSMLLQIRSASAHQHEFFFKETPSTRSPVMFQHMLDRCRSLHPCPDRTGVTPLQMRRFVDQLWKRLVKEKLVVDEHIPFKAVFFESLATRKLLELRMDWTQLTWLAEEIYRLCRRSRVQAGESVGVNATQCLGEPFTQQSLKTPHASGKLTGAISGTKRVANLVDGNFSSATSTLVLQPMVKTEEEARRFGMSLMRRYMYHIMSQYPGCELHEDHCVITFPIDKVKARYCQVSLRRVAKILCKTTELTLDLFTVTFMDSEEDWSVRVDLPYSHPYWQYFENAMELHYRTPMVIASNIVYNLYYATLIHGIQEIEGFVTNEITIGQHTMAGKEKRWSIQTMGSNLLASLRFSVVDVSRSSSSDASEMCAVFGLMAARTALENEYLFIMSSMADSRHVELLVRMMTRTGTIQGMKIKQSGQFIPPLQKAAYEQCAPQVAQYVAKTEVDDGKTVCGAVLSNKLMQVGTGYAVDLLPIEAPVPFPLERQTEMVSKTRVCEYVCSPKADGLRVMMVLGKTAQGAPFWTATDRSGSVRSFDVSAVAPALCEGTVLDGECMTQTNGECIWLIFDCLMLCGNRCSRIRYDHRIELAREAVFLLSSNPGQPISWLERLVAEPYALPISRRVEVSTHLRPLLGTSKHLILVKPLLDLWGLRHFFAHYMSDFPWPSDGLILTKVSDACQPFRCKQDTVLKLKPRHENYNENTIDFRVRYVSKDRPERLLSLGQLLSSRRNRHTWKYGIDAYSVEQFRVSPPSANVLLELNTPWGESFVFSGGLSGQAVEEGSVYEARWNYGKRIWEVTRKREKDANSFETAIRTIQNIVEDVQVHELMDPSDQ